MESKEHIQIDKTLKSIREYLPKSYFNQDKYDIDDCLSEETKVTRFITNPVNAYMIIHRFGNEWVDFQRELRKNSAILLFTIQSEIKGVRGAFYRLSEFYNLDPRYLADGSLSPEWSSISKSWSIVPKHLTANDILEIGKLASKKRTSS
ncbi:LOW QUALITY PROTEIN: hypothetical protein MXB_2082 [Myxobolus squamalis]|nr:LOW QUALITY PROTEIN: hypothetical protein MXB_2082 [Myxobolus squamalis]